MKDWPPSIAPKGEFLAKLKSHPEGLSTRELHKIARDNIPGGFKPNPYTGTNAVRALVGAGCMIAHPEKPDTWLLAPPRDAMGNRAFSQDECAAACVALGIDLRRFTAALHASTQAAAPSEPESPPPSTDPAPNIAIARSILRDNPAQALTLAEWEELCRDEGFSLPILIESQRPAILSGVVETSRGGAAAYYLPRAEPVAPPPPDEPDDDLPDIE